MNGGIAAAKGLVQMLDLNDRFAHSIKTPFRINSSNKKALEANCSKDESETRGTTLIHALSHESGLAECQHTPAL